MANEKETEIIFYEHQFISNIFKINLINKEIRDFFPKDTTTNYIMQESSNNNCLHINKFKGCNRDLPCNCVIITNTSENIDYDLLLIFDLRFIDTKRK